MERPGSVPGTGGSLRKAAERPEFGPDRPFGSAQQFVGSSSTVHELGKGKAVFGSKGRGKFGFICVMVELGTGRILIRIQNLFWPGANHQLKEIKQWC